MEMCYDGALVMPSSYAVMDNDEMTYVEGGKKWRTLQTWPFAMAIDVGLALLGGYNISALGNLASYAIKNLVKRQWSKIGARCLEGVTAGITSALGAAIGAVSIPLGVLVSATSIGGLVTLFMDATDGVLNGKFRVYI